MRVKPTKKTLRATYEMLRTLAPFNEMGLPPARHVRFITGRKGAYWGRYWFWRRAHTIWIYEHKTVTGMVATMAHEMLHLYQDMTETDSTEEHNKAFRRLARITCYGLGIEVGGF